MRIFERLRGRSRSDSAIKRKLFEAITRNLLLKLEDETSIPIFAESKATCCSCWFCARSMCAVAFGDRRIANVRRYPARLASDRACP
jgi:hypothetical protein